MTHIHDTHLISISLDKAKAVKGDVLSIQQVLDSITEDELSDRGYKISDVEIQTFSNIKAAPIAGEIEKAIKFLQEEYPSSEYEVGKPLITLVAHRKKLKARTSMFTDNPIPIVINTVEMTVFVSMLVDGVNQFTAIGYDAVIPEVMELFQLPRDKFKRVSLANADVYMKHLFEIRNKPHEVFGVQMITILYSQETDEYITYVGTEFKRIHE